MPIVFNDLRTVLYNWAFANTPSGMPVIWYFPNSPRPTVDYVTLNISAVQQIGWDYEPRPTLASGAVTQVGDREFTLTAQAYGGDVMTVLNNLRTSLQKQTVLDTLRSSGVVFVDWFPINNITELVDSRFEQRATMDILFRIADTYGDTLGTIAQAEITEELFIADGTQVLDQTVLIPETI